jgi:hypothetical protein
MKEELAALIEEYRWPGGFIDAFLRSNEKIARRYVIVDNSLSMLHRDGRRYGIYRKGPR